MAWIELHQTIWTHRKTLILAAELGIKRLYAAAHLIHLWTWAVDNAPEGNLSGLPPEVIAFGAEWENGANTFLEALINAGWLDREGDQLKIHDWYDYAGRLIEQRKANAERMRAKRAKNVQGTCNARTGATVPNLTVPNQTVPKDDDDPAFALAQILWHVEGWPKNDEKDVSLVKQLQQLYPDVDLQHELERYVTYKLDKPLEKNSKPRSQVHTWVKKAHEWDKPQKQETEEYEDLGKRFRGIYDERSG